jgi:hypothetical protein
MAKFGLFNGNVGTPFQTFDGDRMVSREAEYVDILVGTGEARRLVATIRLEKGQSVKEIK